MEVADRLSLKGDLEIARDIQLAMLPGGMHTAGDAVVCGVTRPANTVGGDFYDILPLPDGRLVLALGDVAGKGSPAALLMALLLAMLRTLVDEGPRDGAAGRAAERAGRAARPRSRFITLFYGVYDPRDGIARSSSTPAICRRSSAARDGRFERIGDVDGQRPRARHVRARDLRRTSQITIEPGDVLVLYSDGITEAENAAGQAVRRVRPRDRRRRAAPSRIPKRVGRAILEARRSVRRPTRGSADDLTALVLKRAVRPPDVRIPDPALV